MMNATRRWYRSFTAAVGGVIDNLLLEDGDDFLLEDGDTLLFE